MIPPGKYRIGAFRPVVPDWARFLTLLMTALVHQFTAAIYLSNLNEMVGSTALSTEDVKMIANSMFCGFAMIFPLLFRIKLRFMSRTTLLTCSTVAILGNLITASSTCMPVLIVTAFLVGAFKMIGTFECMSSLQLAVTPKRDLSVFFCFVYTVVLSSVQLSGLLSSFVAYRGDWRHMHLVIASAHLVVMCLHALLLRPFRFAKKMPLYGIDWLGFALWGGLLILLNFVFEYGKRLDWLDSRQIRAALCASFVLGVCICFRTFSIKRPLIVRDIYRYRTILVSTALFAVMQFVLAPMSVVMPVFTGAILKYNGLHTTSLNWSILGGMLIGIACSYLWLVVRRGGHKSIIFSGFFCLLLANLLLHAVMVPSAPKEAILVPYLIRGIGYAVLYVSLTVYAASEVPFPHFLPALAIIGIFRSALGGTIANSLCNQALEYLCKTHRLVLGQELDALKPSATGFQHGVSMSVVGHGHTAEQAHSAATGALYGKVQVQALLVSWSEMFTWAAILGAFILLGICAYPYVKPRVKQMPSLLQMANYLNPIRAINRRTKTSTGT